MEPNFYFLAVLLTVINQFQTLFTIKVSFGTRNGPIIPPTPTPIPYYPNNNHVAPVYENEIDDIPNPKPYKPYLPYKYREDVLKHFNKLRPYDAYLGVRNDIDDYDNQDRRYDLVMDEKERRKNTKYQSIEEKHASNLSEKSKQLNQRSLENYEQKNAGQVNEKTDDSHSSHSENSHHYENSGSASNSNSQNTHHYDQNNRNNHKTDESNTNTSNNNNDSGSSNDQKLNGSNNSHHYNNNNKKPDDSSNTNTRNSHHYQRSINTQTGNHGVNQLDQYQRKPSTVLQNSYEYRGPQTFGTEEETRLQPPRYSFGVVRNFGGERQPRSDGTVAQLGVIYWNGLRYYVPLGN